MLTIKPAPVSLVWEKGVALVEEADTSFLIMMSLSEHGVVHCLMVTESLPDLTCDAIKSKAHGKEMRIVTLGSIESKQIGRMNAGAEKVTVAAGTVKTRGVDHMVTSLVRHLSYNREYFFAYCFESEHQRMRYRRSHSLKIARFVALNMLCL